MGWKVIKKGLFVTMEGLESVENRKKCINFAFDRCRKFDTSECDDYWLECWEKFRVKVFNKVVYEGDRYYNAEYVYDISQMKHLLVVAGVLWSITIILIISIFLNP